ncbi:dihydrofolate reductase family protein [Catenuloplanes japonicus]|uniref:dihydrofolate reductase family protein n=1 Tax=Catenuloplanes japonicus TaxID=33876 RepID=UPI000526C367|nr:dihydrofolate reductase family protein [Catenuloplanes japonicus]
MRNVVLYQLLSLDGVAEEPGDWMFDVDARVFGNLATVIGSQDAVLLGRGTYDYWVDYWPTSEVEPFAGFINSTTKHVVTSSRPATGWANTVLVDAPVADYVAGLKARDGGDIGIHGSISLAQSLLAAGLVDELRLVITPALAGKGRKLFGYDDALRRLTLLDAQSSPGGHLFLHYRR